MEPAALSAVRGVGPWLFCLVAALLSLAGCSRTTTDPGQVGGQGGLFSVCLGPSDCASGLVCGCGAICTVPCGSSAGTCGDLGAGAVCPDTFPATRTCDVVTAVCARLCQNDGACRGLGPTAACLDGWCKIPQPSTLVDGVAPTCDVRLAPLREQVEAAVASADRSCQVDSDCDNVSASNSCYGTDCPLVYVSKTAGVELTTLLQTLDAAYCDAILRSGCALPRGFHGCPAIGIPACENGSCSWGGLAPFDAGTE